MLPVARARKDRAGFRGIVTDGDHLIKWNCEELIECLGLLGADIDANFLHHCDCFRPDCSLDRTGTGDIECGAAEGAEQPLRHLRAGAVVRADEKHALAISHEFPSAPPGRSANSAGSGSVPSSWSQYLSVISALYLPTTN